MKHVIQYSKLAIVAVPLTICGWFLSSVSLASDTLSLKQLLSSMQASHQSGKLTNEISHVLHSRKINADKIQCKGKKLAGRYSSITVASVPFNCRFPNNLTITINGQNLIILPSGRATPLENAKNFHLMPKPISLSYQITSWNWKKAPISKIEAASYIASIYLNRERK
jgi:hypothetical protein